MLTCKEVTKLVSQSHERRLSWREQLGVRLHLMVCKTCPIFADQLVVLHRACQRIAQGSELDSSASEGMSPEARARIRETLQRQEPKREE